MGPAAPLALGRSASTGSRPRVGSQVPSSASRRRRAPRGDDRGRLVLAAGRRIGSIAPGKIANFTVLEEDPYAVDPAKLADVPVWGTVFEGAVYPVARRAFDWGGVR